MLELRYKGKGKLKDKESSIVLKDGDYYVVKKLLQDVYQMTQRHHSQRKNKLFLSLIHNSVYLIKKCVFKCLTH